MTMMTDHDTEMRKTTKTASHLGHQGCSCLNSSRTRFDPKEDHTYFVETTPPLGQRFPACPTATQSGNDECREFHKRVNTLIELVQSLKSFEQSHDKTDQGYKMPSKSQPELNPNAPEDLDTWVRSGRFHHTRPTDLGSRVFIKLGPHEELRIHERYTNDTTGIFVPTVAPFTPGPSEDDFQRFHRIIMSQKSGRQGFGGSTAPHQDSVPPGDSYCGHSCRRTFASGLP
ncbi:hypothetical protein BD324DRAFT_622029 [Kockovaella imperatae]|uniref:Uncharacterized protein n=1 Tax=Kockovaella imperatae TaxID=4999 RepID=A0A1Y1UL51_9TREE|nr:hypothetical protein BD324DRAFT_622029 [Kockovaella imperatae]ORX38712.1 hypothetical protein BD324DRAFT_622029 [Kockovaella imperatae]